MSAYREGREPVRHKPLALLCAQCAQRRVVRNADDTFVCERCDLEQPVFAVTPLPSDPVAKEWRGLPEGMAKTTVEDLTAFAREMGITEPAASLTVACNGLGVVVEVATSSGHPVGVDLRVNVAGLPPVTLRVETKEHVDAKRTGLTVEVQTGDAAFDERVFVESAAAPEDLALTLASPAVRRAIVTVLDHVGSVELTELGIEVGLRGEGACAPARLRELVLALRTIAGAPRVLSPSTEETPRRVNVARAVLFCVAPIVLAPLIHALHRYATFSVLIGVVAAGLAGLVWLVLQPPLRRLVAGRSRSHLDFAMLRGVLLGDLFVAALAALLLVNGAGDRSAPRHVELVAYEVGYDSEDHQAIVYAMDGPEKHSFSFDDPQRRIHLPATVTATFRQGRLGFPWQQGNAVVHWSSDDAKGK
ncbi:MAG: hypothetical protein IPJ34_42835 [Myxococcales bacterium]|nr:hypothetical protein [Myxococcales bacterium]